MKGKTMESRQSQTTCQVERLNDNAEQISALVKQLHERMGSVLFPKLKVESGLDEEKAEELAPLPNHLRDINRDLQESIGTLSNMLEDLEL